MKRNRKGCAVNVARWMSYAAAGAVTSFAASNDAEAAILYSGLINTIINHSHPNSFIRTLIENSHPGAVKLGTISWGGNLPRPSGGYVPGTGGDYEAFLNLKMNGHAGKVAGHTISGTAYASRLALGANIAPHFVATSTAPVHNPPHLRNGVLYYGSWKGPSGNSGYLAFEFNLGGGVQYGWARGNFSKTDVATYPDNNGGNNFTLVDYAYGTPGQVILAGQGAPPSWTGATDTHWTTATNWNTGLVPGVTIGTTNTDTAVFNQNATNQALVIDAGRNLQNITFDNSDGALTTSLTIGTTGGPALLLTGGGTIQMTASVANPQTVNAPLVLEGTGGTYTFSNNATSAAATLNFGGAITAGASSGVTTLMLAGANTGANTISGQIANGSSGATMALTVQGGNWVLGAANTYTGPTTLTGGQLKVASGGSIADTSLVSISNAAVLELSGSAPALAATVNVANNSSAANGLNITGTNQVVGVISGAGSTVVAAAANLTAYEIRQNALSIGGGGKVTLVPSGSGSTGNPTGPNNVNYSSNVTSLTIAGAMNAWTGTLDIGNNGLVIQYGGAADPFTTIENQVESAYAGGNWTGMGITSSIAAASIHTLRPLNIGLEDFTPGQGAFANQTSITFAGQTITTSAVLVRLTYMDDLVVAGGMQQNNATNDALLFAANYGLGTTWSLGDVTHDGAINSNDALLFAANYFIDNNSSLDGTTGGAALGAAAAVPEPASLGLLAIGAAGVLAIRRRRQRAAGPIVSCLATLQVFVPDPDDMPTAPLTAYSDRDSWNESA